MKRTQLKAKLSIIILLSQALLMVLLLGCGGTETTEDEVVSASPPDDAEVALVDDVQPTATPTTAVTMITDTVPVDYCFDCHVDKEMLIDTADPEEEVISENEGEG
ncbi:MAG: hypothetical protein KC421_04725 [Anaerolineales bacterium]|nr:hypothetical protein [Anaerolineales bacterium]